MKQWLRFWPFAHGEDRHDPSFFVRSMKLEKGRFVHYERRLHLDPGQELLPTEDGNYYTRSGALGTFHFRRPEEHDRYLLTEEDYEERLEIDRSILKVYTFQIPDAEVREGDPSVVTLIADSYESAERLVREHAFGFASPNLSVSSIPLIGPRQGQIAHPLRR